MLALYMCEYKRRGDERPTYTTIAALEDKPDLQMSGENGDGGNIAVTHPAGTEPVTRRSTGTGGAEDEEAKYSFNTPYSIAEYGSRT